MTSTAPAPAPAPPAPSPTPAMAASSSSQLSTPNYVSVASGSSGSGAGHSRPISALKFSHDGRLLASASADASVRIYRVINDAAGVAGGASVVPSTSDAVAAPAPAAPAPLQSLSPRPRLELACELPGAHELGINDLVFSHDNRYLITASDDKNIIVWEIEDSNSSTLAAPTANNSNGNSNSGNGSLTVRPLRTLIGHTSYVFCLSVSGAGNLLASGSYDETVRLWDLKNGRCLRCIKAHSDPVSAVDFNRDGTLVVSSSYDGLCRVWETASGRCLKTIYNEKSQAPVSFVRFSPNGKYILAASLDSTLRLWDYQQKDFCVKTYHDGAQFSNSKFCLPAHFSTLHHPKQYIFSGSEDGAVVLWEVVSMEVVARLVAKPTPASSSSSAPATATASSSSSPVLCVAVHPSLPVLASSNMEPPFAITLWAHQQQ